MRLICYPTKDEQPNIVPAPRERDWMERTRDRFAYRCLPLNVANEYGWLLLNTHPFVAEWSGGDEIGAVSIRSLEPRARTIAVSHFGQGVLTFSVDALFQTEPGYDLVATGPLNSPKDAIQPLTGVVECDWCPFTFTMNWIFTRKRAPITFERDEPFCMIFPVQRGFLETVEPEFRSLERDPELARNYKVYAQSRLEFNRTLNVPGSDAQIKKWQKFYFRGLAPGKAAPPDHRVRVRLKEFLTKAD
ncbi:DUF6065 family protein [Bradyrhizobium sp. Tv2a-2]|uniref:DUF6065 family protein n=1 Tax=Bradyrhizobium sp. Tv2a-2 TaxID=113395 RepID=UPI000465850D|nr:DUF6065 family protein [Bradyrhizobium sp. Tv2a-2]